MNKIKLCAKKTFCLLLMFILFASVSVQAKMPSGDELAFELDSTKPTFILNCDNNGVSNGLTFSANVGRPEDSSNAAFHVSGTATADVGSKSSNGATGGYISKDGEAVKTNDKITVEFDFLLKNETSKFTIRDRRYADDNHSSQNSPQNNFEVAVDGKKIFANRWYKYAVVYESGSQTAKSYLNGALHDTVEDVTQGYGMAFIRLFASCAKNAYFDGYLDNIKVYHGPNGYQPDEVAAVTRVADGYSFDGSEISYPAGATVAALKEAVEITSGASMQIYSDADYTVAESLTEDCYAVLTSADGIMSYYSLNEIIPEITFESTDDDILITSVEEGYGRIKGALEKTKTEVLAALKSNAELTVLNADQSVADAETIVDGMLLKVELAGLDAVYYEFTDDDIRITVKNLTANNVEFRFNAYVGAVAIYCEYEDSTMKTLSTVNIIDNCVIGSNSIIRTGVTKPYKIFVWKDLSTLVPLTQSYSAQ